MKWELFERFDWTCTQLPEAEKQAVEAVLVENDDIFATHGKEFGVKKEFKVKSTPRDDRKPIYQKEYKNVGLALINNYGLITILPLSQYPRPFLAQRKLEKN